MDSINTYEDIEIATPSFTSENKQMTKNRVEL